MEEVLATKGTSNDGHNLWTEPMAETAFLKKCC